MENILLALMTSILTVGITSIVNWQIQKNNYRSDYHKKVVENRMKSYSNIWELLVLFPYQHDLDNCFGEDLDDKGSENFHKILNCLNSLANNGYWLSYIMQTNIIDFYKLIDGFYDPFNGNPNEEVKHMINNKQDIDKHRKKILNTLYLDMEKLHDVNGFFREKIKQPVILGPSYDDI